jgi:hypothetical protein
MSWHGPYDRLHCKVEGLPRCKVCGHTDTCEAISLDNQYQAHWLKLFHAYASGASDGSLVKSQVERGIVPKEFSLLIELVTNPTPSRAKTDDE